MKVDDAGYRAQPLFDVPQFGQFREQVAERISAGGANSLFDPAALSPVVVAATPLSPRCETMIASETPTTTWLEREMTIGHASSSSALNEGVGRG